MWSRKSWRMVFHSAISILWIDTTALPNGESDFT